MKILVLDNYDSFTYNLVHIIRELGYGKQMDIYRNDKISLEAVAQYDKILLSPGPGIPEEAGILMDVIRTYGASKSILGVCLGHQAIAEVYGAELYNMPLVLHGFADKALATDDRDYLYNGLPDEIPVCRYHSWSVRPDSINGQLRVTSVDKDGEVMGLCHAEHDVRGLQFHPESILTEGGKTMIENWLKHS